MGLAQDYTLVVTGTPIETILAGLNDAGVRYVVVGGVAVVLHGHLRFTADLDLVVALDDANARCAISALQNLGFTPRPPVNAEDFANPSEREKWVREKGMTVFSLWSSRFPGTDVDLFVDEPLPFAEIEARGTEVTAGDVRIPVASIPDLISMKRHAGRPNDLEDIRALEEIEHLRSGNAA
jgi:hypothetical protein